VENDSRLDNARSRTQKMWDVISKEALFDPVPPTLPPPTTGAIVPHAADDATTSRPNIRSVSNVKDDKESKSDSDEMDESESEGDGMANKRIRVHSPSPVLHEQSSPGTTKSAAKALFGLRNDESENDAGRDSSSI
jgi:hypothetical protein